MLTCDRWWKERNISLTMDIWWLGIVSMCLNGWLVEASYLEFRQGKVWCASLQAQGRCTCRREIPRLSVLLYLVQHTERYDVGNQVH